MQHGRRSRKTRHITRIVVLASCLSATATDPRCRSSVQRDAVVRSWHLSEDSHNSGVTDCCLRVLCVYGLGPGAVGADAAPAALLHGSDWRQEPWGRYCSGRTGRARTTMASSRSSREHRGVCLFHCTKASNQGIPASATARFPDASDWPARRGTDAGTDHHRAKRPPGDLCGHCSTAAPRPRGAALGCSRPTGHCRRVKSSGHFALCVQGSHAQGAATTGGDYG